MNREEEWMRRAAGGDTDAFGEIVRACQYPVQGFAARMLGGDTDTARDVAQEAFVRLWQMRHTYQSQNRLLPLLMRIARNLCNDVHRTAPHSRPESLDDNTASAAPSPENALASRVLADEVRRALADLPEEQRAVFVLSHYEGLTYRQIADALDCPMGTVASRKHGAVENLRRHLKHWIEE